MKKAVKNDETQLDEVDVPIISGKEARFIRREARIHVKLIASAVNLDESAIYKAEFLEEYPSFFTYKLFGLIPGTLLKRIRSDFQKNSEKYNNARITSSNRGILIIKEKN